MALKPTIYKQRISLSDLERSYYDTVNLTLALHPSETQQRLMARVMAFLLNAQERLTFTKGLSSIEEPDIWSKQMDDQISLWIEVGEPDVDRIKKATHKSDQVKVYSFNTKADVWWQQNASKLESMKVAIYRFESAGINRLSELLERTMDYSVTITGESAYVATQEGECEVVWSTLTTG